jgi:transposase-like protein
MARGESLGQAIADESRSALDAYLREGARQMLQAALECEVDAFLAEYADRADEHGRKQVVRNGYLPARTIMTGAGPLEIEQPRVRDKSRHADERVVFTSGILLPYLRKSRSIEELVPWLYLKGVSTGDYPEALQTLLGKDAKGFSPNVVVRLKEKWGQEYEEWSRRDLSGEEYVYIWADGIHVNVRLEDAANPKQCLLVLMGATAEGRKDLIAVIDGVRESKQSWQELLLDLKQRGLSTPPKLAVGDGALGFWAALREVYPTTREQRCWVHKTANVLNKMPKTLHAKAESVLTRSGSPRPGMRRPKPSTTSWRSTVRSTRGRAAASRRTATSSWPSTTSPLSTGATCGRPTPSRAPSPRSACGIDARRGAARGRPASP